MRKLFARDSTNKKLVPHPQIQQIKLIAFISQALETQKLILKKKKKDHEKYILMHYAYTSQNDRGDHFEALNSISIT